MAPDNTTDWTDVTGSTSDQIRLQAREKVRREARQSRILFPIGIVLLVSGGITALVGGIIENLLLTLGGVVAGIFGLAAMLWTRRGVAGYRVVGVYRGPGGSRIAVVTPTVVDPVLQRLESELAEIKEAQFKDLAEGTAEGQLAVKVRCGICESLNGEQAKFCTECGSQLS